MASSTAPPACANIFEILNVTKTQCTQHYSPFRSGTVCVWYASKVDYSCCCCASLLFNFIESELRQTEMGFELLSLTRCRPSSPALFSHFIYN